DLDPDVLSDGGTSGQSATADGATTSYDHDGDSPGSPNGDAHAPVANDGAAPTAKDAASTDAVAPLDAKATDASGHADATSTGLDPDLDLPAPGGTACSTPGSEFGCPGTAVCRIATTTGGRCEGCTNCGHLHAPCTASDECDTVFQCYAGSCVGICLLGSLF